MTIQEVVEKYKAEGHNFIEEDYRDIVEVIRQNRLDFEIPNSNYSHFLYLTELMFQGTSKNICMLNGMRTGCDWLDVLQGSLTGAIERIKNNGGSLRAIFVGESDAPQSIVDLHDKFRDTVQFITATATKPIKHFIACDNHMLRDEELHKPITPEMDSREIKATVYLDNPAETRIVIEKFDTFWNYLQKQP